MTLATEGGRDAALDALAIRRANKPRKVNNAALPAGSPMIFYCVTCGHTAHVLPEIYTVTPKKLCSECQVMKDLGWLT